MRATLEIDDDLMLEAKDASCLRNQSIGRTISDWVRLSLNSTTSEPQIEMRDGIPVLIHPDSAIPVTKDLVRKLAEEE